jgi:hypothetical protein
MRNTRLLAVALLFALVAPITAKGQDSGWEEAIVSLTPLIRYDVPSPGVTQFVQFPAPLTSFRSRRIQRFWDTSTGITEGRSLRAVFDQVELEYDGPYNEAFYDAMIAFQGWATAGKEFKFDGQYGEGVSGVWYVDQVINAATLITTGSPLWPTAGGRPFIVQRIPEDENPNERDRVVLDHTEPIGPFGSTYFVYWVAPGMTRTDWVPYETIVRPEYSYFACVLLDDNFELDILDVDLMHVKMSFRNYAGITTP